MTEVKKQNPIITEIIRNAFISAAEEMNTSLFRSAYTPIIYEMKDCAVALYNENLDVLGQSSGVPLFLGNLDETVHYAINYYGGKENINEGDVVILNDSYISGTHLNDMTVFMPIYFQNELVGFAANRAHWLDVGAKDPLPPMDSTSIYQEGIRLGPIKIIDKGIVRTDIIDTICLNSRFPRNARGDLNGMIAGCKTGEKRMHSLIGRFGKEVIKQATDEIFEQTAILEQCVLNDIASGIYVKEGVLDNDGFSDNPVKVRVKLTVGDNGSMHVDLTGSSPQQKGGTNCGLAQTISAIRVAYKMMIQPMEPATGGSFRGLTYTIPARTIFSAEAPAPFSWYYSALGLLIDLFVACLAEAAPELSAAAHYGDSMIFHVIGNRKETGELFAHTEPTIGGWGGNYFDDGQDCLINVANGDFKNYPTEIFEHHIPCMMEEYSIRQDSEGAGFHRGGQGVVRRFSLLQDDCLVDAWFERAKCPAWGILGGETAKGPEVTIYDENGHIVSNKLKMNNFPVKKGWLVELKTGGGGGYGNPWFREPERVLYDVKNYFISKERGETVYGVVIDKKGAVDVERTNQLRLSKHKEKILT